MGRSNVGKSSLINAICGKKVAFSSKTPGRTQCINFFSTQYRSSFFVDVPGYGFAKANRELRKKWSSLMPEFIKSREQLKLTFVLIDAKVGFMESDFLTIGLLEDSNRSFDIVFNKSDRVSKVRLEELKNDAEKLTGRIGVRELHFVSAKKPTKDSFSRLKYRILEAIK